MVSTAYQEACQVVIPNEQHFPGGKETGEASHVKRWDNTLRQQLDVLRA